MEATNLWVAQDQGSKSTHVGLSMITSTKVQMPSLVSTMLTCQRKKLNVFEKTHIVSCSRPTWKSTSCTMVAKVSQIASWIHVCSMP